MPVRYLIVNGKRVESGHVPHINPEQSPLRQEFRRHAGYPSRWSGGIVIAGTVFALALGALTAFAMAKRPAVAQAQSLQLK